MDAMNEACVAHGFLMKIFHFFMFSGDSVNMQKQVNAILEEMGLREVQYEPLSPIVLRT